MWIRHRTVSAGAVRAFPGTACMDHLSCGLARFMDFLRKVMLPRQGGELPMLTEAACRGLDRRHRFTVALATCLVLCACDSHRYAEEGQSYTAVLKQELARLGACEAGPACPEVFWEAGGFEIGPIRTGAVHISVYGVSDPAVARAIGERCKELHAVRPHVPIELTVYSTRHPTRETSGKALVVERVRFAS